MTAKKDRRVKDRKRVDTDLDCGAIPESLSGSLEYFSPMDVGSIKLRLLVKARTSGQQAYLERLRSQTPIEIVLGPAGTGKTFLACYRAMEMMRDGQIEKFVITRPAVESDEQLGFLPGGVDSKMLPFVLPILDCLNDIVGPACVKLMIKRQVLQIRPFAFMRGSTFARAFILADEMQNSSEAQFKNLITRIGEGSKMVVSGDLSQSDRQGHNGLAGFLKRLETFQRLLGRPSFFGRTDLQDSDVVRHEAIQEIMSIYEHSQLETLTARSLRAS